MIYLFKDCKTTNDQLKIYWGSSKIKRFFLVDTFIIIERYDNLVNNAFDNVRSDSKHQFEIRYYNI